MNFLVTAGPTRESIDAVRFISNRSSGKMGYAVVEAALLRGHRVRLVSGPVSLAPPPQAAVTLVTSAGEMLQAVEKYLAQCDVLVMCAAVSDWRPAVLYPGKIKKNGRRLELQLEPTPDILRCVAPRKGNRLFVGFAAETEALEKNASAKLLAKKLDFIVANDVSRPDAGFEADTNCAVLLGAGGFREEWPLTSKREMAARLVAFIESAAIRLRSGR